MAHVTDRWRTRRNPDRTGPPLTALPITLILVLGLMATLVWMVGFPTSREVQAMPAAPLALEVRALDAEFIRVATTGEDTEGCGVEEEPPCRTMQYAVDKAQAGDEIRVAAGTYNEIDSRESLTQVVYLTKSLTIRGGYTTSDWTMPDPEANPTTLDAQGQGRVMVISPTITIHLEGLRLVGGNATGLGGGLSAALTSEPEIMDAGGGLYVLTATVTISNSLIFSNTGSVTGTIPGGDVGGGLGGGIYVRGGSIELRHNTILSNTAGVNVSSYGGGVYVDRGSATLLHNVITSNTACIRDDGYGGGLYLYGGTPLNPFPSASLLDNTLQGNYASRKADGQGGGLYANHYQVELMDNLVQFNTGGTAKEGKGGGLYIFFSEALLEHNLVRYNVASRGEEGISGGVHFCTCPDVTLKNNTIFSNTASTFGNGYGGGVSFCKTTATLDSNAIISNTATLSTTDEVKGWGGGVWTGDRASVSFNNDLIAGNHARTEGSGLWFGVEKEVFNDRGNRLQHVTIADNSGGIGQGIYVTRTIAYLTNTVIASHTVGIYVDRPRTGDVLGEATLEATLWYKNEDITDGRGYIEIGDLNYYDDNPAFVDPGSWDYHIGEGSSALDRGVATGVRSDMDGERRPWLEPDLGADEYWPISVSIRAYLPLILR